MLCVLISLEGDYETSFHSDNNVQDLCCIQVVLKQPPIDKPRLIHYIEQTTRKWMREFEEPHPDDLVMLISDLDKLKVHLSGKSGFASLDGNLFEDEKAKAQSTLEALRRAYAELKAELELLKGEVLLQEKTNEQFASREKYRVEAEHWQSSLFREDNHDHIDPAFH